VPLTPLSRDASRRLVELEVGETARMVDANVDAESRALLRALGLTDRSLLRVCKRGEPCVVQVRATRIGISSRIAEHIVVLPEPDPVSSGEGR
jgi:Fe2+ transport system protein FeoA